MVNAPALEIAGLQVRHGPHTVLDVERLALEPGGVLAVLGRNGAGKTTLLHALAGLLRAAAGDVYLDGRATPPEARRRLSALVLQRAALARGTVELNAAHGLRLRGVGRHVARARGRAALALVGLEGLHDRDARTLSGGEAQRLALARALAVEPGILLLDEPTTHLDAVGRGELHEHLSRALGATRPTTVLVTHDPREAARLATRLVVLDRGRVVQDATPTEARERPATALVAQLLGVGQSGSGYLVRHGGL
jgi:ABC-type sulfate/molybdate transport systems ATPase subunit